jgi:oxygen-independent coproporphyrinogen-3 oxidase
MSDLDHLRLHGLFDARVPRYTSYPPATVFSAGTGAGFHAECLAGLDPKVPVSVYLHIPFCERLCWFCACRTQGTQTLAPVAAYLDTMRAELALIKKTLPVGVKMERLHWGGGTPTILPPDLIRRLAGDVYEVFPTTDSFEFSVEIDPSLIDNDKINALAEVEMNRASIGIQDFDPEVQAAIGRDQSFEQTRDCVDQLRLGGIRSLNFDLVYGLPKQTMESFERTVAKALTLEPDRIALFGYAHVPHMSKRQKLIDEATLPGDMERFELAEMAANEFACAGFEAIGIDHFARPGDGLSVAQANGSLRRNFQGYTADGCETLIGVGASSISRFAQGYVQNAAATAAYSGRVNVGELAGIRGHRHSDDDLLRARMIEMLMCDFAIDLGELARRFCDQSAKVDELCDHLIDRFETLLVRDQTTLAITGQGRPLCRIIANALDAYRDNKAVYSRAS